MIKFRPLPYMTLIVVIALAVMLLIGRIEFQKYQEKEVAERAPVSETTIANYEPLPNGVVFVHGVRDGEDGWRVFAPVRNGEQAIFVDCDFVTSTNPPDWHVTQFPAALSHGAPVRGAEMHPDRSGPLVPPPQPLNRIWYDVDLAAMGRAAGLDNVADYYLASAYVGADGRAAPNPFAKSRAASNLPLPAGQYFGYALTWWGLSAVLVVIYFAYHSSVGRLQFTPPPRRD